MNVLITGVSKGIGKALVDAFLNDDRIEKLFVISSSLTQLSNNWSNNPKVFLIQSDFLSSDFISPINKVVGNEPIHVLINNAGFLSPNKLLDVSNMEYQKTFDINFKAPLFLIQALTPNLIKGKGHTINIGSMGGFQGSMKFPGLALYSASKAALANLTECLDAEFGKLGLRFNCLALGAVNTDMLRNAFPEYEAGTQPQEIAKLIHSFVFDWGKLVSGKVLPISLDNPE